MLLAWEMLLTRDFNQPLSQRGMSISIALCSIAIVVVVWPAVGFCFPTKTPFSSQLAVIFASYLPTLSRLTNCAFHSGKAMYQEHVKISHFKRFYRTIGTSSSVLRESSVASTLAPVYVVNDLYGQIKL